MTDPTIGLTFNGLREANVKRRKEIFQDCKHWVTADWAMAVAGELGELCNLLKKVRRGEPQSIIDIQHEIADTAIYLDLLANHLGVDLGKAIRMKFNIVSEENHCDIRI